MSVWSGAGVPVIGDIAAGSGLTLSGTQVIVLHLGDYITEHPIPGREGGTVERVGRKADRIEIHGLFRLSGADQQLASLSGMIGTVQQIQIPSFNSGWYFLPLAVPASAPVNWLTAYAGVLFETLQFRYVEGRSYPRYDWVLRGVVSGLAFMTGSTGIDYVKPSVVLAMAFGDYLIPNIINSQIYIDYLKPDMVQAQIYVDYLKTNEAQAMAFGNYVVVS